ncbi:type VII secretion system-associated protein [Streptomyces sp. NPDC059215]|uniref:type VII secretion system-associated protein n=1 Tax=Streptomyces sp. NPDC059215 TaxID=3346772 RepID=UPI0036AAA3F6
MDLTHLDAKSLRAFVENDVASFKKELDAIRKDDPSGVRALQSIVLGRTTPETLQENQVLGIGLLGSDDLVNGKSLVTKITDFAKSVDDILLAQTKLFEDIDDDLRETIKILLKTQSGSLESISGEKLLDIFSDIDEDLAGPKKETGGDE